MSMIGKTLGNFECTALLGKGGMGEVYKAKDQKLGRDVAIKVLPEEFAKDADRVARFQREAKLLASLNHPNIAAIHGLEESDGTHFLVMELVEGVTLEDYIAGNAGVPAGKKAAGMAALPGLLKLALQIAEALEAAHEKGVIHRDLKPANIKITPDGKAKVLDFGLAKAFAGEQGEVNLSQSPTLSEAATQQGVILGTAAYMSPEQAKGKTVDKKTDIWAFGAVLFEMLTGRQLFSGDTVSETLAAVLMKKPDFSALPQNLHPKLVEMLDRCLEKDTKNRYHDIADARVDIQKVLADPGGVLAQPGMIVGSQGKARSVLPWVAVTAILCLIIAGAAVWFLKPSASPQVMRFDYKLPEGQDFSTLYYQALAISPDGKQFVYSTPEGLYLRSVEEFNTRLIPGTEGYVSQPFFSPDGKWIGYFSVGGGLKKISINGGTPVTLCDAMSYGVNWTADSTIIYGQSTGDIMQVSANGGTPESLIEVKNPPCVYPQMLPDGKTVLFTEMHKIVVQSLESGNRKELFKGYAGRYLPTGHIVYGLEGGNDLYAVPFDLDKLEVTGNEVTIAEDISSPLHWAFSDSGTLVYIPPGVSAVQPNTLVWVDRKGTEEQIPAPPGTYRSPQISPDGSKIALTIVTNNTSDIWIWDIVNKTIARLTDDGSSAYPLWTPDGGRIFFSKFDPQKMFAGEIYWKSADGSGKEEIMDLPTDRQLYPWSWSSDGKIMALIEAVTLNAYDIGIILSMEGEYERKPLIATENQETSPVISPDGKWLAYWSLDESARAQVYVCPLPDVSKGRWQATTDGGVMPLWSPDGKELFYRSGDSVLRVSVETKETFKAGQSETLFQGNYVGQSADDGRPWDIHPDGKRFLMIKPSQMADDVPEAPRKINIVVNWFEELKERVPVE